jgi:hypothetical protein
MHHLESHPKIPPLLQLVLTCARRRLLALDRDQLICLSHEAIPSQASSGYPTTTQLRTVTFSHDRWAHHRSVNFSSRRSRLLPFVSSTRELWLSQLEAEIINLADHEIKGKLRESQIRNGKSYNIILFFFFVPCKRWIYPRIAHYWQINSMSVFPASLSLNSTEIDTCMTEPSG